MQAVWLEFLDWLHTNRDHITAISALVGVGGAIIAIIALFLTYKQIRDAKRALQAGNTYEIQKEAREIIGRLYSNSDFNAHMFPEFGAPPPPQSVVRSAEAQLGFFFHFYLSVYRQAKAGGLTKTLISSMGKDFKGFFSNPKVQDYFESEKRRGTYDREFDQMVDFWNRKAR